MNLKTSLLKDKKSTSEKLRIENKQMELRLQQLKLAMCKEKEERLSNGNKSNWSTGSSGALLNYKPTISAIDSGKKIRLKMLKQETLPSVVRTTNLKSNIRDIAEGDTLMPKSNINVQLNGFGKNLASRSCGQCEESQAAVSCKECAEDYCPKCFAAFHLKGALRKHRSTPISALNNRVSIPSPLFKPPDFKNISNNSSRSKMSSSRNLENKNQINILENTENKEIVENSKENLSPKYSGTSLAAGKYDEELSNQYFQEAMHAWRSGIDLSAQLANHKKSSTKEHSTETLSNNQVKNSLSDLIQFTPSLTYAEQLLLRKHRSNQLAPVDMRYILERLAKTNEMELLENQKLLQSNLVLKTSLINSNTEKALKTDNYRIDFDSVNKLLNDAEVITGRYSSVSTRNILQSPLQFEEIPSYYEDKLIDNKMIDKTVNEIEKTDNVQENTKSNLQADIFSQINNANEEKIATNSNFQRPKSVINRNNFYDKPLSARRKSARHQKGGKITTEPSVLLNILANLSNYLPSENAENSNSSSENKIFSKRPSSADVSLSNNKISYDFYKLTPNSWKPAQAWSVESLENKLFEKCDENNISPMIEDYEENEIEEELTKLNLLQKRAKDSFPFSDGLSSHKSYVNEENDRNILSDADADYYDKESEKNEIIDQLNTLERELTVLSKQNQQNNYDDILIDSLDIANDNECFNSMDSDKLCFEDSLDFQHRFSNNSNKVYEENNVDDDDVDDDDEMLVNCSSRFDDYEDVYKLN